MDWLPLVQDMFQKELERLLRALEVAREAQRMAPTPIESHSNTMMSEMEKLVTALEIDIAKHKRFMEMIPKELTASIGPLSEWHYVEIDNGGVTMKLVLVPEGMGGKKIVDFTLVSMGSPLGKILMGKRVGDEFDLNGRKGKIINV